MEEFLVRKMKIKKTPIVEKVYDAMKDCIISQQWPTGEKIPSEKDLAEMFGVNRVTVRMALQKLNTLGIVETRVGEGTFVLNFNFRKYIDEVSEFTMQMERENNIRDFRKLIEIECVRLAIERATKEEIDRLEKLIDRYRQIGEQLLNGFENKSLDKETYMALTNADLDVHYRICKMSHNELYANAFHVARNSIYQYIVMLSEKRINQWLLKAGRKTKFSDIDKWHYAIFNAIKDRDFATCQKLYTEMIDDDFSFGKN
jgi:Transcriptional regulators